MDKSPSVPNVDDLRLDDSGVDDLFASPEQPRDQKLNPDGRLNSESKLRNPQKSYDDADSREARLRQELENVRRVNRVIEDAVASLEKAKGNMDTVSRTVANASALLNTWTRILSQTEHNQRLILNPAWHGATQDLAEAESDALARQQHQQHAERREREEQQRRQEAARRKADEQEAESQRKEVQAGRGTRGTRGGLAMWELGAKVGEERGEQVLEQGAVLGGEQALQGEEQRDEIA
ncbi:MAG: hypothetical protein M1821_001464 [Bathelium mastoideum]|nr:MAG: hypothetical protein M1821_001464 [Bathelium mastoideum]